jgi:hypothetical protein
MFNKKLILRICAVRWRLLTVAGGSLSAGRRACEKSVTQKAQRAFGLFHWLAWLHAKEAGGRWNPEKRLWFVGYGSPARRWKSIYM